MPDSENPIRRSPSTVDHALPVSPKEERKRRIIEAARQQAEQPSDVELETHHRRDSDTGSGRLAVRCPSCHEPMEVAVDTPLTDLTCSACGSHFSLVDQSQATRMAPALSTMGRFELVERIGVGGFGSVWKARDKELDRTVAVKVPRQGGMTAEEQEKFFREARAAAQLRHPSIVSVHEVGRDGDSVYIVSDFVRGVTLGDWLTGQRLTSREAAELCAKIADALHHAHEQGVVHRDLKPANVMIDGDGQPHLMDFGLARREVGEVTVTMDGQVLGTPAYMSPEQAAGEAHTADRRSDVYSLGVILFQLLTSELPFRGNARMITHQVINDPAPSPRKLNANIPKDLETMTLKCLEKEPARRYQTARESAEELRRFLSGKPIHARPVGRIERAWRWAKRRPTAAALLTVLAAVAVIAPLVATRQAALRRKAQLAQSAAQFAEGAARIEAERAEREADTAKRLANVSGAKYTLTQGRVREAYQQIAAAIKSQPSLEYGRILDDVIDEARRDWQLLQRIPIEQPLNWGCFVGAGPKWFVISRGDMMEVRSLLHDHSVTALPLAGGGNSPCAVGAKYLAVAAGRGKISVFSLPDLTEVATYDFPGKVVEIRSDAEGRYFAAVNDQGFVRVFERNGGQRAERQFATAGVDFPTYPSVDISPSGQSVSYDSGWYPKPKWLWKWKTNEVTDFDVEANQLRFDSDELGYGHLPTVRAVEFIPILDRKGTKSRYRLHGFLYSDGAKLEGLGVGKGASHLALLCDSAIHFITQPETRSARMSLTRYDSLWPQADSPPRLLSYDRLTHTLALATDREVIVFTRWLPDRPISSEISTDIATSRRILATAGDFIFTCRSGTVQVLNVRTLGQYQYALKRPQSEASLDVRRVTVTPNARWAAVLWQETDNSSQETDDRYLRKLVQVYELPRVIGSGASRLVSEFELEGFFGGIYYLSGELVLSANGQVVTWCDAQGLVAGYRVDDAERIFKFNVGSSPSYAVCSDPPLLGAGDYRQSSDYRVWNLESGQLVCQVSLDAPIGRQAFSPAGDVVYVGLASNVMRAYRLSDSKLLSEVKTPAAPVVVRPVDDRYVGFVTDEGAVGSMVLAEPSSGRTLEVIHADAFVLDDAYFSLDGNTIVFVLDSNTCQVMKGPSLDEAVRRLERTAIDPDLAAKSADLLDYRERLAAKYENDARNLKESDSSADDHKFEQALEVWTKLAADFPKVARYRETVATEHERLASDAEKRTTELSWNDRQEVRIHLAKAVEVRKELVKDFPEVARFKSDLDKSESLLHQFKVRHSLQDLR